MKPTVDITPLAWALLEAVRKEQEKNGKGNKDSEKGRD